VRVYLPLTFAVLAEAHESGEVPAGVEAILAEDDSEEAEYAALMAAADASASLIVVPGRRVVLVADVVDPAGAVPRNAWAALHVDTEDDADPDDDLAWYGIQEISDVLAGR